MRFYELLATVPDDIFIEIGERGRPSVTITARNLKEGPIKSPFNYCNVDKVSVGSVSEQEAHFTGCPIAHLTVEISR